MRRGYKRTNNLTTDTYIPSMTLLPTLSAVGSTRGRPSEEAEAQQVKQPLPPARLIVALKELLFR